MACLAAIGNISHYHCAIEILDYCRQQVQNTGKVVAGLPSLAMAAVPESVSQSKQIGHMRINIAVEGFMHGFPSF